jgi:hypothetical protein
VRLASTYLYTSEVYGGVFSGWALRGAARRPREAWVVPYGIETDSGLDSSGGGGIRPPRLPIAPRKTPGGIDFQSCQD